MILEPADALSMLDEAEAGGLRLLGFDGFFLPDDIHIQPSLADSRDYSRADLAMNAAYADARRFIQARAGSALYFEIVLADGAPPL